MSRIAATLFFVFIGGLVYGQTHTKCPEYEKCLERASNLLKSQKLEEARREYSAAKIFAKECGISDTLADKGINAVIDKYKLQTQNAEKAKNEAIKQTQNAERNLKEMSELITSIVKSVQGDKSQGIIGFKPLKAEILEKLISKQNFISQNSEKVSNQVQSLLTQLQLGLTNEFLGKTEASGTILKKTFEESLALFKRSQRYNQEDSETLIEVLLNSTLYYSWGLINADEITEAEKVLAQTDDVVQKINDRYKSANIYSALAGFENAYSRYFSEIGDQKQDYLHGIKAVEYIRKAIELDSFDIGNKRSLLIYIDNLTIKKSELVSPQEAIQFKLESCRIADQIDQTPGNGNMVLQQVINCRKTGIDTLVKNQLYTQAVDLYKAMFKKLDEAYHIDPHNKDILLYRSDLYLKYALFNLNILKDTVTQKAYTLKAANDFCLFLKDREVLPTDLWLLENVFDRIDQLSTEFKVLSERKKMYSDILEAFEPTAIKFRKASKIAYISVVANTSMGQVLLGYKTRSDSISALPYFSKAISDFESIHFIEKYSDFSEDITRFSRPYVERLIINIDLDKKREAMEDYETLDKLFMPLFLKYRYDFYLGQPLIKAYKSFGNYMCQKNNFELALRPLKFASLEGTKESTDSLVAIYQKPGFANADSLQFYMQRTSYQSSGIKRVTIPTDFDGTKQPFDVYIIDRAKEYDTRYTGIRDQAEWVWKARGGRVSDEVISSFDKVQNIAWENNVKFTELTVYALGKSAETPPSNTKELSEADINRKKETIKKIPSGSEIYYQLLTEWPLDAIKRLNTEEASHYRNIFLTKDSRYLATNNLKREHYLKLTTLDSLYYSQLTPESSSVSVESVMSSHYNSLAWYSFLTKQFDKVYDYLLLSKKLDPKSVYPDSNIPHYYLFTNQIKKAKAEYMRLKDKPFLPDSEKFLTYKHAFLADFEEFEKEGIYSKYFDEIRRLLNK